MLFSRKSRGYFVEMNDHGVMVARTSAAQAPFVIEDLQECPADGQAALNALIGKIQTRRTPSGYLHANVGIYARRRLVRRQTLEPKRLRDAGYLNEICSEQFRIEQDKYALAIMNAADGSDFDGARTQAKDVVFCGLPTEDLEQIQSSLLSSGIYPESIEIGSVATLGAMVNYLAHTKSRTSVQILEIGSETTHSFIVTANGVEASRPVSQGLDAMVPIVQRELGLKDEESARKLFFSNTFDFTGMGPLLTRKLLKELQSSIGFYEVQTGQSVGHVLTTQLAPKLQWLDGAISTALGIPSLRLDPVAWLEAQQIQVPESMVKLVQEPRWFGILSLMLHAKTARHADLSP